MNAKVFGAAAQPVLKLLSFDQIETNKVQPPGRAEKRRLVELLATIRKNGLLQKPLVACVQGSHIMIDGHRRAAVWNYLGHATIECLVIEADSVVHAQSLFAEINSATAKLTMRDYFYQWAVATDPEAQLIAMGGGRASHIRRMIEILGVDIARAYGKTGKVSPGLAVACKGIHRSVAAVMQSDVSQAQILHWLIKHEGVTGIQGIMRHGSAAQIKAVERAIRKGEAYKP